MVNALETLRHGNLPGDDIPVTKRGARTNLTKARGARTREVILEEAATLFSSRGYRGTSLRDISERVGISHPGMLHHFSRKDALLQAVLERASVFFEELIDGFVQVAQDPRNIRDWDAVRQYQSLVFAVVRAEALDEAHPGREQVVRMQQMAEEKLTGLFRTYEEKGWLQEGATPEWVARSIVAMRTGVFVRDGLFQDNLCDSDLLVFMRLIIKPLREVDPFEPRESAEFDGSVADSAGSVQIEGAQVAGGSVEQGESDAAGAGLAKGAQFQSAEQA